MEEFANVLSAIILVGVLIFVLVQLIRRPPIFSEQEIAQMIDDVAEGGSGAAGSIIVTREGPDPGPNPILLPEYRKAIQGTTPVCTCPSGDGSLSWPCPVHPPEAK